MRRDITKLYKPLERTQKEARKLAIEYLTDKILRLSLSLQRDYETNDLFGSPILLTLLTEKKKWLRRIESDRPIFRAAVWLFQPDDPVYIKETKTWYVSCANDRPPIINPFRVHDCEVTLLSLEETLEYLKSKAEDKSLQLFPDTYDQLEEFWKLYPEGMIEIG